MIKVSKDFCEKTLLLIIVFGFVLFSLKYFHGIKWSVPGDSIAWDLGQGSDLSFLGDQL